MRYASEKPGRLSRRAFVKLSSLAGATVSLSGAGVSWARLGAAEREHAAGVPPTPSWVDKPMRWAQLTLVEDDPGKFDPQFWLNYFKRTKSDAVCLSAGGCVAYYPTKAPDRTPSKGRSRRSTPRPHRPTRPIGARSRRSINTCSTIVPAPWWS